MNRWSYNARLRRWYHPTGASSSNSANDRPEETDRAPDELADISLRFALGGRPTTATLPCSRRGEEVGSVSCGCGGGNVPLPVYTCAAHRYCTVSSPGKPVRFEKVKPAVCLGCAERG